MSDYFVYLYNLFLEVCHTREYERKWAKIFSSLESFPSFSKICVFNNLLGPEEMIL